MHDKDLQNKNETTKSTTTHSMMISDVFIAIDENDPMQAWTRNQDSSTAMV